MCLSFGIMILKNVLEICNQQERKSILASFKRFLFIFCTEEAERYEISFSIVYFDEENSFCTRKSLSPSELFPIKYSLSPEKLQIRSQLRESEKRKRALKGAVIN